MAQDRDRGSAKKKSQKESLPFTKRNYMFIAAGLVSIILGYIALAQEPWDGALPLVVAPILLVLGYCVLVPIGILVREREETRPQSPPPVPGSADATHV